MRSRHLRRNKAESTVVAESKVVAHVVAENEIAARFARTLAAASDVQATNQFIVEAVIELSDVVLDMMLVDSIRLGVWNFRAATRETTEIVDGTEQKKFIPTLMANLFYLNLPGSTPDAMVAKRAFLRHLPELLSKIEPLQQKVASENAAAVAVIKQVTNPSIRTVPGSCEAQLTG
jgi:hypothetical protein